jgi:hypothetical protein
VLPVAATASPTRAAFRGCTQTSRTAWESIIAESGQLKRDGNGGAISFAKSCYLGGKITAGECASP